MGRIIFQKNSDGNIVYPVTIGDAIAVNSTTLTKALDSKMPAGGKQTSTSNTDGGSNVYTFADGSTITVKNGSKGSTGSAGTNGTSAMWFTGTSVTGTSTTAVNVDVSGSKTNDMYLNTSTFNVYKATAANSWVYLCNIKGAKGDTGANGIDATTNVATLTNKGLMSASDKTNLEIIKSNSLGVNTDRILNYGAHAEGYSTNNGSIYASGRGSHSGGYAEYYGYINSTGSGSRSFGYARDGGYIISEECGSLAGGCAYGYDEDNGYGIKGTECGAVALGFASCSNIEANGQGSLAMGLIFGDGDSHFIQSDGEGSIAIGKSDCGILLSDGSGSFATGLADISFIGAQSAGSFARGAAFNHGTIVTYSNGSCAEGYAYGWGGRIQANGTGSHAEGYASCYADNDTSGIWASGIGSHAEGAIDGSGDHIYASGKGSHAEGYMSASASGIGSHAEGSGGVASGNYSHAEGYGCLADGEASNAKGYKTTTVGKYSTTSGRFTYAKGFASTVIGCNNIINTISNDTADTFSATNNAFIIGGGTIDGTQNEGRPFNAFRVTFDGKVYGQSAYNSTGADYAEYFEWEDGNKNAEDRIGKFVSLTESGKIKIAEQGEDIIGVISGISSVIGNAAEDTWDKMYLRDIYGRPLYEYVEVERDTDERETEKNEDGTDKVTYRQIYKKDENGKIVKDEDGKPVMIDDLEHPYPVYKRDVDGKPVFVKETVVEHRLKLNPDYDPTKPYIPRSQRKEWDVVGLLGQMIVIDDGSCKVGKKCSVGTNGVATFGSDYRVIKRLDENHVMILGSFL